MRTGSRVSIVLRRKKVVGYALSSRINTQLALAILDMKYFKYCYDSFRFSAIFTVCFFGKGPS